MSKKTIFIGPEGVGKTCFCMLLQGQDCPKEHVQTRNLNNTTAEVKDSGNFLGFKKDVIVDLGGQQFKEYKELIEKAEPDNIFFMFNGVKLIEELKNFKEGGDTTMRMAFLNNLLEKKNTYYIATHADQYKGHMKEDILKGINEANDAYKSISGEMPRYRFKLTGRLFAVNATDAEQVNNLYKEIVK